MANIERTFVAPFLGVVRIEAEDEEEYREKVAELRKATIEC
jgi:hypothetical protein